MSCCSAADILAADLCLQGPCGIGPAAPVPPVAPAGLRSLGRVDAIEPDAPACHIQRISVDNPDGAGMSLARRLAGDDLLQRLLQCLTELRAAVSDHEERTDKGNGGDPDLRTCAFYCSAASSLVKSRRPSDFLRADPKELCDLRQGALFFIPHAPHLDPLDTV